MNMKKSPLARAMARLCLGAVLLGCPLTPPACWAERTAAEIVRLDNRQFYSEVLTFLVTVSRQPTPSLPDLWLVMDSLQGRQPAAAEEITHALHAGYLAAVIARHGTQPDFDRLLKLSDQLPPDGLMRRQIIHALLEFGIRLEVAQLTEGKTALRVSIPEYRGVPPTALSNAPPELLEVWRRFKAAAAAQEEFAEGRRTNAWVSAQANWSLFLDTLSDLLHGRDTNAVEHIRQFEWGGWCGTGSDELYGPKYQALFLALLKERRFDQALAVSFWAVGGRTFRMPFMEDYSEWQRRFIRLCGLDWEELYAGALLELGPYSNADYPRKLAQHGTEKAARFLALMAGVPTVSDQTAYLRALGAFLGPSEPLMQTNKDGSITVTSPWWSGEFKRVSTAPIPANLQTEVLKVLDDKLRPGVSTEVAAVVCQVLCEARRPECKPALRRALELPYPKVREQAWATLRALGEQVPEPAPLGPVAFRFLVDGQPARHLEVDYELRMSGGRATTSSRPLSSEGIIRLDREYFVDPQYPITNIVFAAKMLKSLDQPWFEIQTPPPTNLEAVTSLNLRFTPVTLTFTHAQPEERFRSQSALISLRAQRHKSYGVYFDGISDFIVVPYSSNMVFSALQPGRYEIQARIPGAALWQSGPFEVGLQPVPLEAKLEPGADVRCEIIPPGKTTPDRSAQVQILRDAKPVESWLYFDWRTNLFRSLPMGKYVLRVPSSSEQRQQSRDPHEIVPKVRGHQAEEVPFTIDAQSPRLIDLGSIRLRPSDP
jgi:hypothetical protein